MTIPIMNPEQEISSSFNLVLDPEVAGQIRALQQELSTKFAEQRNYDSSPHLSIATKFMGRSVANDYAKALVNEFSSDEQWTIEFAHFSAALSETSSYIFLNLSESSKKILFDLHKRALGATTGIGFEGQNGLAPKYAYDPHISIIKLQSKEEVEAALALINKTFSSTTMPVKKYEITRQEDRENGFSDFPVIAEISLQ